MSFRMLQGGYKKLLKDLFEDLYKDLYLTLTGDSKSDKPLIEDLKKDLPRTTGFLDFTDNNFSSLIGKWTESTNCKDYAQGVMTGGVFTDLFFNGKVAHDPKTPEFICMQLVNGITYGVHFKCDIKDPTNWFITIIENTTASADKRKVTVICNDSFLNNGNPLPGKELSGSALPFIKKALKYPIANLFDNLLNNKNQVNFEVVECIKLLAMPYDPDEQPEYYSQQLAEFESSLNKLDSSLVEHKNLQKCGEKLLKLLDKDTNESRNILRLAKNTLDGITNPDHKKPDQTKINVMALTMLSQMVSGKPSALSKKTGKTLFLFAAIAAIAGGVLLAIPSCGASLLILCGIAGAGVASVAIGSGFFHHGMQKGLAKDVKSFSKATEHTKNAPPADAPKGDVPEVPEVPEVDAAQVIAP